MGISVYAANWGGCLKGDVAQLSCIEPLVSNVIQSVAVLAGVTLFIMLLVGGFNMMISGGDAKKLESAKGTVTNAIIGLVVIVAAYLILKTIEVVTGVTVTQFSFPTQ